MALSRLGTRNRPADFTWPGFVDALASLLMVFVFVLMVFVLIQANLAYRLSGQDASDRCQPNDTKRCRRQIAIHLTYFVSPAASLWPIHEVAVGYTVPSR